MTLEAKPCQPCLNNVKHFSRIAGSQGPQRWALHLLGIVLTPGKPGMRHGVADNLTMCWIGFIANICKYSNVIDLLVFSEINSMTTGSP